MKAVLISIKPKWCELIASGKKTLEVRKNRPKLETPFKVYIYCTADMVKHIVFDEYGDRKIELVPQRVIGEFACDRIDSHTADCLIVKEDRQKATIGSCLSGKEILEYLSGSKLSTDRYSICNLQDFYCWHISNLEIYENPKELSQFNFPPERFCEKELCGGCPKEQSISEYGDVMFDCEWKRPVMKAPQSWCYVEEVRDDGE